MTAVSHGVRLEWRRYDSRGTRSRVMDHFSRGNVEFELCGEGGQWVIRRTRNGRNVTVMETARGRPCDALDIWKLIIMGTPTKQQHHNT